MSAEAAVAYLVTVLASVAFGTEEKHGAALTGRRVTVCPMKNSSFQNNSILLQSNL